MLLEPTPIRPPSRRSPVVLVALVALVPALVAVVAAPSVLFVPTDPAPVPIPETTADASARPADATPAPDAMAALVGYPATALGLMTLTIAEARGVREAGAIDGLVAVAGYMTVVAIDPSCIAATAAGGRGPAFCEREAILADVATSPLGADGGSHWSRVGPHLHLRLPPGVATLAAVPVEVRLDQRPIRVLVVGRLVGQAQAASPMSRPRYRLVVEHVPWADGHWLEIDRTLDPLLGPGALGVAPGATTLTRRERAMAVLRALPDSGPRLSEAKVTATTLARIDPAAAEAVGDAANGPLWYIRVMIRNVPGPEFTPRHHVATVVLEDGTGTVLATLRG